MSAKTIAEELKQQNKDAVLALQAGELEWAYSIFVKSLQTEVSYGLLEHAAKTRVNMANILFLMKKYREAYECLKGALDYFEQNKDMELLNDNRILEGYLLLEMQELEELNKLVMKMLADSKNDLIHAYAYIFSAEVIKKSNNRAKSIDTITKAVTCAERAGDKKVLANALAIRAALYDEKGRSFYATIDRERIAKL